MISGPPLLEARFDWQPRTRVVFGAGTLAQLGALARELDMTHVLLVADHGVRAAGYVDRALGLLRGARVRTAVFHDFDTDPDSDMVAAGAAASAGLPLDGIVALGGGSSLDCAKGINFLRTGGGTIADYRGYGKAGGPMLPMIGIPTSAGTGSEAQSYAVISDARTRVKMACGDPGAAFRVALLDPDLTRTQPRRVAAAAGYDALSHAVEAWVTRKRTPLSLAFAREAWRLIDAHLERAVKYPEDSAVRAAMLLGSHVAGLAVEQSMLGAAHACANPLTARYGTTHGVAVALMLPHVVRWNGVVCADDYGRLASDGGAPGGLTSHSAGVERLATRLELLARTCGFPGSIQEVGAAESDLSTLAADAAQQWTGTFNPRPLTAEAARALYTSAFST